MTVDLRSFEYGLEPLLRQRQWRMAALEARLGRAVRALNEAREAVESLRAWHEGQARRAAETLASRIDPAVHPRVLEWLAGSRRRIAAAQSQLDACEAERRRVAAECAACRRALDAVERHREDCIADHVRAEQGRVASDADREWLVREGGP